MWHVIAEEDLVCTECRHKIRAGSGCLSQMPEEMPDGFHRRKYENFCLACTECNADKDKLSCYVKRLNHWYTPTRKGPESVHCGHCGNPIPKGTWVVSQKLYAWPELDEEWEHSNGSPLESGVDTGVRATGTGVLEAAKRAHSGAWRNLSPQTQRIFRTGGLGRGFGSRSPAMAQRFYETSIPAAIRNQGEGPVLKFLHGKHASHIKSVSKVPRWARRPSNVLWESAKKNLSRGNRNMTSSEVAAIKSANSVSAIGATARGAAKGGVIAAVMEAPVTGIENFLHWRRGRKSRGQATKDAAKSTVGAAAVGLGVTAAAGVAKAGATLVGISPNLGPAGLPLAAAGVALMVGTATHRLYKAAKRDIPLDEYYLYFCNHTDCKTKFAQHATDSALGGGRRGYTWAIGLALASLLVSVIAIGVWLM